MRIKILTVALLSGLICSAEVFKLTELTVTSQTQTTGSIFVGGTGDAPSNIGDKTLWSLVVNGGDTKTNCRYPSKTRPGIPRLIRLP